jgi:BirA family biotin operon repressor/biotin-[acetyl-CoA-carboxylase] ligase
MGTGGGSGRLVVERVERIDSTNSELLRREPLLRHGSSAEAILLVATSQTGGRGRRQRAWISTPAASLTASFAREVLRPAHLGALSLVAGLVVAQALETFGASVRLKWPNDIYAFAGNLGGKAGGILCEARARGDVTRVVIGFGLNLLAPSPAFQPDSAIAQPVAGLFEPESIPDRAALAEALGHALLVATDRLLDEGFEPFRQAWSARDMLVSRAITVHDETGSRDGVAVGIDGDGALLVRLAGGTGDVRRLLAEEVSVRLQVPSRPSDLLPGSSG